MKTEVEDKIVAPELSEDELKIIRKCYEDYVVKCPHYDEINRYYYGNTDSLMQFTPLKGRSNLKVTANFVQKLVDEEAQYSFGNKLTYVAKEKNDQAIKDIDYYLSENKSDHDINLGTELIKNGIAYEINYYSIDENENFIFKNKAVSPLNGYMYIKDDEPLYFLHIFKKQLDDKNYIDVYTKCGIYHFNENFILQSKDAHFFKMLPVGCGIIGGKQYNEDKGYIEGDKTIYRTIKSLQDAFETNLSDVVCEISDFRNAILKLYGWEEEQEVDDKGEPVFDSEGKPVMKPLFIRGNSIMNLSDKKEQDAEWLIKNINDVFIKNTRDDVKDLIYTLTSHIDTNEKLQSNLSGVALRSRLQNLEAKCGMNELAMLNILRTRLKCLFRFLYLTASKNYDVNLIKIEFTPNIPVDEMTIAQMIAQIPHEVVSNETKRSWLPRIENPVAEGKKIKEEMDEVDLDVVVNE